MLCEISCWNKRSNGLSCAYFFLTIAQYPMENINNTYFDGYYKDIWRTIIPPQFSQKETDFIQQFFSLDEHSHVLDLMCGYGRHAIALAKKGIKVTAVDNLKDYVDEIKEAAEKYSLPLIPVNADIIDYTPQDIFDLAIWMGNSLCFFNKSDTVKILKTVHSHLKQDGCVLINTWMLAEIVFNNFKERDWSAIGDVKLITGSKYLLQPSRIEAETMIIDEQGNREMKTAVDYIYSIAETEQMLQEAGFELKMVYTIPGKKKFSLGDTKAYILAEKK